VPMLTVITRKALRGARREELQAPAGRQLNFVLAVGAYSPCWGQGTSRSSSAKKTDRRKRAARERDYR